MLKRLTMGFIAKNILYNAFLKLIFLHCGCIVTTLFFKQPYAFFIKMSNKANWEQPDTQQGLCSEQPYLFSLFFEEKWKIKMLNFQTAFT